MGESTTADGVTLTTFAREFVDPLFEEAGARKKGRRRYEFTNPLGDVSLFEIYSRGYDGVRVGFDAGCLISPRSKVSFGEWKLREDGKDVPSRLRSLTRSYRCSAGVRTAAGYRKHSSTATSSTLTG